MNIVLDSVMFRKLMKDTFELGGMEMLLKQGKISDKISQRQAKKIYKSKLAIWEKRGLIEADKQGGGNSTKYYSRKELEILEKSEKYEK